MADWANIGAETVKRITPLAQKRSVKQDQEQNGTSSRPLMGRVQLVVFAVLLVCAGSLWFSRDQVSAFVSGIAGNGTNGSAKQKAAVKGVPVVVAKTGLMTDDAIVGAIGTGRAQRSVMLFPEVSGEIEKLFASAGQRVNKGQSLVHLDSRDAQLAMRVARTRLVEAERLHNRALQLRGKNITSQANVDDARNVVERARLELEQAAEALAKREIRAPFTGVVGIPKVESGDRVSPTTDMLTLDDRSRLTVEFEVAEQFMSRLDAGQEVTAHTPSFPTQIYKGRIEFIDTRINPTSRTVMVRARIPNERDTLRPGMSFVVDLKIPGPEYPTVHELALQWRKGISYVWRVKDNKAEKVEVRSVKRLNNTILVDGDISAGDLVVIEGVHRLRPGRLVKFVSPDPVPSS